MRNDIDLNYDFGAHRPVVPDIDLNAGGFGGAVPHRPWFNFGTLAATGVVAGAALRRSSPIPSWTAYIRRPTNATTTPALPVNTTRLDPVPTPGHIDPSNFDPYDPGSAPNGPSVAAPTPVSRVQAPTTSSHYTGSMNGGGYAPMYGEQGVVVDFANEASKWQKAAVGRDDLSYFRAEMPSQPTDWYRRSLRFPHETQKFSRVTDNFGVPPFDPSGPGSDVGCMVPCIGAAAAAAMVF